MKTLNLILSSCLILAASACGKLNSDPSGALSIYANGGTRVGRLVTPPAAGVNSLIYAESGGFAYINSSGGFAGWPNANFSSTSTNCYFTDSSCATTCLIPRADVARNAVVGYDYSHFYLITHDTTIKNLGAAPSFQKTFGGNCSSTIGGPAPLGEYYEATTPYTWPTSFPLSDVYFTN